MNRHLDFRSFLKVQVIMPDNPKFQLDWRRLSSSKLGFFTIVARRTTVQVSFSWVTSPSRIHSEARPTKNAPSVRRGDNAPHPLAPRTPPQNTNASPRTPVCAGPALYQYRPQSLALSSAPRACIRRVLGPRFARTRRTANTRVQQGSSLARDLGTSGALSCYKADKTRGLSAAAAAAG